MLMDFNFKRNEEDDNEELDKEVSDMQNEINKEAKKIFIRKLKFYKKD